MAYSLHQSSSTWPKLSKQCGLTWSGTLGWKDSPLRTLQLELEAFAFERRLRYQAAVFEPTSTLPAVFAGGCCAQAAMLLVRL